MSGQDIRIVELLNWRKPAQPQSKAQSSNDYSAITYYNKILVRPVKIEGKPPLLSAYDTIQELLRREEQDQCVFHQTMIATMDIQSSADQQMINRFWSDDESVFFFMTMVNVPLDKDLEGVVKRIRKRLEGKNCLLYFTYEYNEILIFHKGSHIQEYTKLVTRLGFQKSNRGILDTITLSCFNGGDPKKLKDKKLQVCIQMGIVNYAQAMEYLEKAGIRKRDVKWVLGRSDIGFIMGIEGIPWLQQLYQDCAAEAENMQWLSTVNVQLLIPLRNTGSLAGGIDCDKKELALKERIGTLCAQYSKRCQELSIPEESAFPRILTEVGRLVENSQRLQMAQDLAVCTLPELEDFLSYLEKVLHDPNLQESHTRSLRNCLDAFYLNMLTMISSTVHSNQEFVQIPHSAPPSLEMPPKIMAYYSTVIRQIIQAFQDEDVLYGVMLAPKLIDQLEVVSIAIRQLGRKDQLLSVSIGENMLYDPKSAVAILGHEMAHFVGESTRARELRREKLLSCYLYLLLDRLCQYCIEQLPTGYQNAAQKRVNPDVLSGLADDLAAELVRRQPKERPLLQDMVTEVGDLDRAILYDTCLRQQIWTRAVQDLFQLDKMDALMTAIGYPVCGEALEQRFLKTHAMIIFDQAVDYCLETWREFANSNQFDEFIAYLFSESYADLAMVMLFDMKLEDYIQIFENGLLGTAFRGGSGEDIIELTRFIAVARVLSRVATSSPWRDLEHKDAGRSRLEVENEVGEVDWNTTLYWVSHMVSQDNPDIAGYCVKNGININLLTHLVSYLLKCAYQLRDKFERDSKSFKQVRTAYKITSNDYSDTEPILSRLVSIRKMEMDCLNHTTAWNIFSI